MTAALWASGASHREGTLIQKGVVVCKPICRPSDCLFTHLPCDSNRDSCKCITTFDTTWGVKLQGRRKAWNTYIRPWRVSTQVPPPSCALGGEDEPSPPRGLRRRTRPGLHTRRRVGGFVLEGGQGREGHGDLMGVGSRRLATLRWCRGDGSSAAPRTPWKIRMAL